MLTQLCLENFKTWKRTRPIRLAPITVFFGANSSGKSSLGQFLLMLHRTMDQPDRNVIFHTSDDRNPVDLGSYRAYVHGGDETLDIAFSVNWQCPNQFSLQDRLHDRVYPADFIGFRGVVGQQSPRNDRIVCKRAEYRLNPSGNSQDVLVQLKLENQATYRLKTTGYTVERNPAQVSRLSKPNRFYGFPDDMYAYYQNVADFAELQLEFERVFRDLHYLGPLRQYPRRDYTWTGQTPSEVGFQGENTIPAILAGGHRKISPGDGKRYRPLPVVIGTWLKKLQVVKEFRVVNTAGVNTAGLTQVRLKMHGHKSEVTLPDVGFGVSQVLPVVAEAFYAPPNSTVIIEQPELHLHPAVQSEMGDLFIEAIRSKEDGAARNLQFLIESHSEHFLRRLQRRVAEGELGPQDIAMYFCEPPRGSAGSSIRRLEVDDLGNIHNWPANFFGDQMTDIAEMRKAGLQRRMRAQKELEPQDEAAQ